LECVTTGHMTIAERTATEKALEHHRIRAGSPLPFGASLVPDGVNFSFYSSGATACTLVLYKKGEPEPYTEIEVPAHYRIGDVFAITVLGLAFAEIGYGFRLDEPHEPE